MLTNYKICENLDQCLCRLDENPKLAVAISREYAYNSHLISPSQFYCFEKSESIYEYTLKFLVRANSTILADLNKFIQRSIENGLMKKWHSDSRIRTAETYTERVYGQLQLSGLQGIFIIGGILFALTIFLFLIERLVYRKVRTPNTFRFWKYIEIIIDADRHFWLDNKWSPW